MYSLHEPHQGPIQKDNATLRIHGQLPNQQKIVTYYHLILTPKRSKRTANVRATNVIAKKMCNNEIETTTVISRRKSNFQLAITKIAISKKKSNFQLLVTRVLI